MKLVINKNSKTRSRKFTFSNVSDSQFSASNYLSVFVVVLFFQQLKLVVLCQLLIRLLFLIPIKKLIYEKSAF